MKSLNSEDQVAITSLFHYMVADTEEWEQGVAKKLEQMTEVFSYVKNQSLGFYIPYEYQGISHQYLPDFITRIEMSDKSIFVQYNLNGKMPEDFLSK